MNSLVVTLAVVIMVLALLLTGYRLTTRDPNKETPKRRELRRANVRAITAERAMHDLEGIINRYRPVLDDVESALVYDITERVQQYKTKILEIDQ